MVEYVYQVKDNIQTEKQISIIKGKEKNLKEKSELSFFLLLLKEKSNMNRFQVKKKHILYAYSV